MGMQGKREKNKVTQHHTNSSESLCSIAPCYTIKKKCKGVKNVLLGPVDPNLTLRGVQKALLGDPGPVSLSLSLACSTGLLRGYITARIKTRAQHPLSAPTLPAPTLTYIHFICARGSTRRSRSSPFPRHSSILLARSARRNSVGRGQRRNQGPPGRADPLLLPLHEAHPQCPARLSAGSLRRTNIRQADPLQRRLPPLGHAGPASAKGLRPFLSTGAGRSSTAAKPAVARNTYFLFWVRALEETRMEAPKYQDGSARPSGRNDDAGRPASGGGGDRARGAGPPASPTHAGPCPHNDVGEETQISRGLG